VEAGAAEEVSAWPRRAAVEPNSMHQVAVPNFMRQQ
jgi:hypothetical protein